MNKQDLVKINDFLWEIPQSFNSAMRVPARIYASEKMLEEVFRDHSINQLINVASLPGIINYSLAMPDIHEGYGFPIGGVAAISADNGVISPGGVGYDINCGMRILLSDISSFDINEDFLNRLATEISKVIPSGLGKGQKIKISQKDLIKILEGGSKKLIEDGYGQKEDFEYCESFGCLAKSDANLVSLKAKKRGEDQLGTLGSGNHFLEIQKVNKIFDKELAEKMGIFENQIVIMIHTGSRGLGHQIATDYIQIMMRSMLKYDIKLADRELACAPFKSKEGQDYFSAMSAAANFAWANRQMITYYIRQVWKKVLGENNNLKLLYDVAHNIAKLEEYEINGQKEVLIIHRKGATRAFPKGHLEIPEKYRLIGQPVLIPGSMGSFSYILIGKESGKESWYSTCHGAGRKMSRTSATKNLSPQEIIDDLKNKNILIKCDSLRGLAEEAPQAYKNIDEVVEVVCESGLSSKVIQLKPLAVIKGE